MNHFSPKISHSHEEILQQSPLGQRCGSQLLFRDRYKILRMLGRGGFGITFLAKDVVLPGSPLCVIKQLCLKTTNSNSWKLAGDRFEKEAKILGLLGRHSQIPMLLDYCLTTQRCKNDTRITSEEISPEYQPPVAKTAHAIREWRAKLKARNSQQKQLTVDR